MKCLQPISGAACVLTKCRCVQARRGGLKDCTGDELLSTVFKATIQQTGVEPAVRKLTTLHLTHELEHLNCHLSAHQHKAYTL